ncbi:E3 ubiquitin-protein ligase RZFP34-like protein [Drosera capensis]
MLPFSFSVSSSDSPLLSDSSYCIGPLVSKRQYHCDGCGICRYACPLCSKSVCDMSKVWEKFDIGIAATPMPETYQNKMASANGGICQLVSHQNSIRPGTTRVACFYCILLIHEQEVTTRWKFFTEVRLRVPRVASMDPPIRVTRLSSCFMVTMLVATAVIVVVVVVLARTVNLLPWVMSIEDI